MMHSFPESFPMLIAIVRRGVLAALLLFSTLAPAGVVADADALAKAYAGLDEARAAPRGSELDAGRLYRKTVGVAWQAYQKRLGVPMGQWAATEIGFPGGGTVFYPFSGPDFVTVAQLFPDADRYVLVAIQGARQPVDPRQLPAARRQAFYDKFVAEWQRFGVLGFFRTNDLDDDAQDKLSAIGVTPILMAFSSRLGYEVDGVTPIAFSQAEGDYVPIEPGDKVMWNSVRLHLARAGKTAVVDYVRLDLSDAYLKSHEPQRQWLERLARQPVLLKAASHLLQRPGFTVVREAIVAAAPLVVQDETGLDHDQLAKIGDVALYGRFVRPYKLFDRNSQQSLAAAYRSAARVGELPFSFSYIKSADQRSVQVARRRPLAGKTP